jgi:hypothetical protein
MASVAAATTRAACRDTCARDFWITAGTRDCELALLALASASAASTGMSERRRRACRSAAPFCAMPLAAACDDCVCEEAKPSGVPTSAGRRPFMAASARGAAFASGSAAPAGVMGRGSTLSLWPTSRRGADTLTASRAAAAGGGEGEEGGSITGSSTALPTGVLRELSDAESTNGSTTSAPESARQQPAATAPPRGGRPTRGVPVRHWQTKPLQQRLQRCVERLKRL